MNVDVKIMIADEVKDILKRENVNISDTVNEVIDYHMDDMFVSVDLVDVIEDLDSSTWEKVKDEFDLVEKDCTKDIADVLNSLLENMSGSDKLIFDMNLSERAKKTLRDIG